MLVVTYLCFVCDQFKMDCQSHRITFFLGLPIEIDMEQSEHNNVSAVERSEAVLSLICSIICSEGKNLVGKTECTLLPDAVAQACARA